MPTTSRPASLLIYLLFFAILHSFRKTSLGRAESESIIHLLGSKASNWQPRKGESLLFFPLTVASSWLFVCPICVVPRCFCLAMIPCSSSIFMSTVLLPRKAGFHLLRDCLYKVRTGLLKPVPGRLLAFVHIMTCLPFPMSPYGGLVCCSVAVFRVGSPARSTGCLTHMCCVAVRCIALPLPCLA